MYRFIFILFALLYTSSQAQAVVCPDYSNKRIGGLCSNKSFFGLNKVPGQSFDKNGDGVTIFLNKCAFFPFNIGKKKIYGSERTAEILSEDSVPWNNNTLRFLKDMRIDPAQRDQYEVKLCKYELRSNDDGTGRKKQAHMFVVGKKTGSQNKDMGNFVNTSQRSQSQRSSVPESFSPPPPPTYDNEMDKGFSTPYRGLNDEILPPPPPSYHEFNDEQLPPPPSYHGLNDEILPPPPSYHRFNDDQLPPPPPLFDDGLNYSDGIDGDFAPPPPPPSMDGFGGGNFAPPPPPPSPNNFGERRMWNRDIQTSSSQEEGRGSKNRNSIGNIPSRNEQGMFINDHGEDLGNAMLKRRADMGEDEDQDEEELNMNDEYESSFMDDQISSPPPSVSSQKQPLSRPIVGTGKKWSPPTSPSSSSGTLENQIQQRSKNLKNVDTSAEENPNLQDSGSDIHSALLNRVNQSHKRNLDNGSNSEENTDENDIWD